jgi:hypothetical protein
VKVAFRIGSVAALTLATACGKPLGTYEVRDVRLVRGEAVKAIEPYIEPDPQMLRIEFASKTDLYEASDGGGEGLYVYASFFPFQDKSPLYVSEPYYNDRQRYDPVTHEDRRPLKDHTTGDYVYTTYLRLRGDASVNRGHGRLDFTGYDLRRQHADLCLRIHHPGYFITPSRSRVFKVPGPMIRRALLNQPPA